MNITPSPIKGINPANYFHIHDPSREGDLCRTLDPRVHVEVFRWASTGAAILDNAQPVHVTQHGQSRANFIRCSQTRPLFGEHVGPRESIPQPAGDYLLR